MSNTAQRQRQEEQRIHRVGTPPRTNKNQNLKMLSRYNINDLLEDDEYEDNLFDDEDVIRR